MKHLKLKTIGKLLRLAQLMKQERMDDDRSPTERIEAIRRRTSEKVAGIYEGVSAKRNLHLFLESLSDAEKREVSALFYFGRHALDDLEYEIAHPALALDQVAYHLSDKTDLHDSIIEGIKRLGEPAPKLDDEK